MLPPREVLLRRLFDRLKVATGCPVTGGEQAFLMGQPTAEQDLMQGRDAGFEEVLKLLRKCNRLDREVHDDATALRKSPQRESRVSDGKLIDLDPEHLHARVISRQIGRTARESPEVREFREAFFGNGGQVISHDEANALLSSQGPRYLSKKEFDDAGLPLIGHKATIARAVGLLPHGEVEDVCLTVESGECVLLWKRTVTRQEQRVFRFLDADWGDCQAAICAGSCFDLLREAAHEIAPSFEMTEHEAALFLLTGEHFVQRPLRASTNVNLAHPGWFQFATITLTAQPFVSHKSLVTTFAREQRKLLGRRKGRSISESNLMLLDFVRGRIQPLGTPLSWELWERASEDLPWPELHKDWNRINPRWHYDEPWLMRRDYESTNKAVLFPGYERFASALGRTDGTTQEATQPKPVAQARRKRREGLPREQRPPARGRRGRPTQRARKK